MSEKDKQKMKEYTKCNNNRYHNISEEDKQKKVRRHERIWKKCRK